LKKKSLVNKLKEEEFLKREEMTMTLMNLLKKKPMRAQLERRKTKIKKRRERNPRLKKATAHLVLKTPKKVMTQINLIATKLTKLKKVTNLIKKKNLETKLKRMLPLPPKVTRKRKSVKPKEREQEEIK